MELVIFILIIILPGYLLLRALFKNYNIFLTLPVSFVLGLTLLVLAALPSYIFALDFSKSLLIIIFYTILLFIIALRRGNLVKNLEFDKDHTSLGLFVLVLGSVLMTFLIEPHFDGDALFHLGQIRKLAENDPVSPTEAFFPIEAINPAYGYSVWYFAISLVAFITKSDVINVWSNLFYILLPISILSFFAFAYALFQEKLTALIGTISYVFILGFVANAWEFRLLPYPDQIARHLVLFVSLYFFLVFIRRRDRLYFVLTVLSAVLLTMIHLFSWVHFLIAVGSFGLVSLLIINKGYFIDSLQVVIATLLLSAPYLFFKLQSAGSVVGTVLLKKDAINLPGPLFMINPLGKGPIFILAGLLVVYLLYFFRRTLKKQIWLVFIASSALAGALVMFNPIVAPITSKLITYTYMHRLGSLMYKEVIIAAFVFYVIFNFRNKVRVDRVFKNVLLMTIVSLLIVISASFTSGSKKDKYVQEASSLTEFIKTTLPEKSVFAADMWTSYNIPSYTNNYILATFPAHMTSNVHKPRRIEDLKRIFSSDTTMKETKKLLDQYEVSYVVVIDKPKKNDILVDQRKFLQKEEFKEIYNKDSYKIYSYEN